MRMESISDSWRNIPALIKHCKIVLSLTMQSIAGSVCAYNWSLICVFHLLSVLRHIYCVLKSFVHVRVAVEMAFLDASPCKDECCLVCLQLS